MDGRKPRAPRPWDDWFAAGKFAAVKGVHFDDVDSFIAQVRQRAVGRGVKVHAKVSDDGCFVMVTLVPRSDVIAIGTS
jgi:hypothetical protein